MRHIHADWRDVETGVSSAPLRRPCCLPIQREPHALRQGPAGRCHRHGRVNENSKGLWLRGADMRDAAIISTARTGEGKAYLGAFNDTAALVLSAHIMNAALDHAGIDRARVNDVHRGVGTHCNTQSYNLGRPTVKDSNMPDSTDEFNLPRMFVRSQHHCARRVKHHFQRNRYRYRRRVADDPAAGEALPNRSGHDFSYLVH